MDKGYLLRSTLQNQAEFLESQGYTVAYICIYGSQNYGLDIYTDDYKSDIDMKAVIVPTLDDLVRNSKPISMVINTEVGQCDIKDIRLYFENLLKANPSYIETLFTDYYYINPRFEDEFNKIRLMRDDLMNALAPQFVKAMYGMMCEKEKAMCHPYPSIADKIEKYGYDGKQLSHAYRLLIMMIEFIYDLKSLERCLHPNDINKEILLDMKLNRLSLDDAKERMAEIIQIGKREKDDFLSEVVLVNIDFSIKDHFLMLSQKIIKNKIINETSEKINE